ncbi:cytochrome c oxidase accessory protein CcoG, partial [Alishewanella sp. SMS9]|nr:cytochrome c oxidase accessory protein CcoG [Alishewanella sp. SMS9]
CNLCVHVCPTGIDIRNGLQYECINCGACIDACDDTMTKMGYPKGLISYTTEHTLQGKPAKVFRPKLLGYFFVLILVCVAFVVNLAIRKPLELDIIRDRGALYRETPEGLIENTYTLSIINKSQQPKTLNLSVMGIEQLKWIGDTEVILAGGESRNVVISLALDPYYAKKPVLDVSFTVTDAAQPELTISQENKFFAGR